MKTVLYNINDGSVSREYDGGYIVDGQPGWLPEHIVELSVTESAQPEYDNDLQYLTEGREVDLENGEFKLVWEINDYTETEIALRSWHHPEFPKRIVAPADLINAYPAIGVHMLVNKLPIEPSDDGTTLYLYMRVIRPEHQSLVDSLNGVITVELIPGGVQ